MGGNISLLCTCDLFYGLKIKCFCVNVLIHLVYSELYRGWRWGDNCILCGNFCPSYTRGSVHYAFSRRFYALSLISGVQTVVYGYCSYFPNEYKVALAVKVVLKFNRGCG